MRFYIFTNCARTDHSLSNAALERILYRTAEGTDTSDLVVALYLCPGRFRVRGTAYVRRWMTPAQFMPTHGHWKFVQAFSTPTDLPDQFKLIRLRLEGDKQAYPRYEADIYGWKFLYPDFETHLAHLFAHELHHFRRYHLGLHPREGEHSANRWAGDRMIRMGWALQSCRIRKHRRRKPSLSPMFFRKMTGDPFASFRSLKKGDKVRIHTDPAGKYTGQDGHVIRPIRANSKRLVIQTSDGRAWRWPMNWLEPEN